MTEITGGFYNNDDTLDLEIKKEGLEFDIRGLRVISAISTAAVAASGFLLHEVLSQPWFPRLQEELYDRGLPMLVTMSSGTFMGIGAIAAGWCIYQSSKAREELKNLRININKVR